jgi:very-long-chain ceramide synthase
MLWSVWTEFDLIPYVQVSSRNPITQVTYSEHAKQWNPAEGVWFPYWMKYQVFAPLLALQIMNLFWYFLIWRILLRYVSIMSLFGHRSYAAMTQGHICLKN